MRGGTEKADMQEWELHVHSMLRSGFGVEDIRVKLIELGIAPNSLRVIRQYVQSLREEGRLSELCRRKK